MENPKRIFLPDFDKPAQFDIFPAAKTPKNLGGTRKKITLKCSISESYVFKVNTNSLCITLFYYHGNLFAFSW